MSTNTLPTVKGSSTTITSSSTRTRTWAVVGPFLARGGVAAV